MSSIDVILLSHRKSSQKVSIYKELFCSFLNKIKTHSSLSFFSATDNELTEYNTNKESLSNKLLSNGEILCIDVF